MVIMKTFEMATKQPMIAPLGQMNLQILTLAMYRNQLII